MTAHLVLASALNLRLAPDKDSGSLGSIPRFVRVEEIGANIDRSWLNVRVEGREGWASNAYLFPENLLELPWLRRAVGEFGVGEYQDSHDPPDNPRIREYHDTFGGPSNERRDSVAWCSSFVNWCLGGQNEDVDRSARSWGGWGEETVPEPGSIAIFWRRPDADEDEEQHGWSKQRLIAQGWNGHVSFLLEVVGGQAICFGGNQSSRANALGEVNKKAYPIDSENYGLLRCRIPPG